uniref:Mediator of RNA polymerase II transcription subunit 19 n=2 Tax=Caenorhabditis tropicalis TaxID=1561998 RepID=A0A1I7TNI2_9PELO
MNEPTTSSGPFQIGNNATLQNMKDQGFYTLKPFLPQYSEIQGNHDLLTAHGLGPVEGNFSGSRRVKEKLSSFLPHIIGEFHLDATKETSSLRALIEKPPIHKELSTLSSSAMQGFKLSAGPVDERYRHLFERRREDGMLAHSEKLNLIRVRQNYDPYELDDDETERQFPRKHKKKKKDKKRKKDKEGSSDFSSDKKKRVDEQMEF